MKLLIKNEFFGTNHVPGFEREIEVSSIEEGWNTVDLEYPGAKLYQELQRPVPTGAKPRRSNDRVTELPELAEK